MRITNVLPLSFSRKGSGGGPLAESEQVGASSPSDQREVSLGAAAAQNPGALGLIASHERLWTTREAASYLGVSPRWLEQAPIPKVNLARPGAKRAMPRYRKRDLDAYAAERVVSPSRKEGR
jgi:hypothetical protein